MDFVLSRLGSERYSSCSIRRWMFLRRTRIQRPSRSAIARTVGVAALLCAVLAVPAAEANRGRFLQDGVNNPFSSHERNTARQRVRQWGNRAARAGERLRNFGRDLRERAGRLGRSLTERTSTWARRGSDLFKSWSNHRRLQQAEQTQRTPDTRSVEGGDRLASHLQPVPSSGLHLPRRQPRTNKPAGRAPHDRQPAGKLPRIGPGHVGPGVRLVDLGQALADTPAANQPNYHEQFPGYAANYNRHLLRNLGDALEGRRDQRMQAVGTAFTEHTEADAANEDFYRIASNE